MAGQRLGSRSKYVYFSDDPAIAYILEADDTLAQIPGVGDGNNAAIAFDPVNPPTGVTVCPSPSRFKPRGVYIQSSTDGARKFLTCYDSDSALFIASQAQAVGAIDTDTTFLTTGRRGECLTF